MLRQGIITEIYPDTGKCRVKFLSDDIVSKPLQICVPGAQDNKFHVPFAVNELVACIIDDNNEDGIVVGALYNDEDVPSGATQNNVRMVFKDGSIIDYDFSAHKLTIDAPSADIVVSCKTADVSASDKVTVSAAGGVDITGNVSVTGNLEVSGNVKGAEVSVGAINLSNHKHLGVQPGGGVSGTPTP